MGYIEHYSNYNNSLNNDVEKEAQGTKGIVIIVIKILIFGILLYTIYTINNDNNDNIYIKNNKTYLIISLILIIGLLFGLDIITFFKLSVFIIFGLFMLALIYKYLDKLRFLILFYHSFNYQLEKIYNETKTNYNEVLFSFIFIAIISIISIVLYWDNIYTDAKKLSKCGKIINTIENNNRNKKPFVYNIIIINNDLIDTTTSKYILKITYDFMKKKTVIDYGSDNGDYKDGSESFKKPDYYLELNNKKQEIKNLESRKDNLGNEIKNLNRADANYDANYKLKTEELSEVETKIKQAQNEYDYIKKLNDEFITAQKKLVFYYFNLKTMKSEKIENIDANILNEEKFKYILVDDNNNKLPYDETSRDLIKFTKIYSKNEKYNINIINDIIYAKNNREKLFI